jgi:5-methylcytosine-specific restriction endonuclease McrA
MNTKPSSRYDRVCIVCGKSFVARRRETHCCSNVCAGRAGHPGTITRACIVCGKSFTVSQQYARETCSHSCLVWYQRSPDSKPIRACLWCGDSLDGKSIQAKWCNARCWHAMDLGISWKRIRDRRCVVCGKPIPRTVNYQRVVCSSLCRTRNRSVETLFRQTHARRKGMIAAQVHRVPKSYIQKLRSLPCRYCGGPGGTADHVVPISRGGKHSEGNLVPACRSCNSSKAGLLLVEWNIKRRK